MFFLGGLVASLPSALARTTTQLIFARSLPFALAASVKATANVRCVSAGPGSKPRKVPVQDGVKPTVGAYSLRDNAGARTKKKRVGRGLGSGKGKTSGRGHKGYHARASKARPIPGFEGGQAGLLRAIPQLGGHKGSKLKIARVHLDTIQHWIDRGRLDASKPIGIRELAQSRCVGTVKDGVTVLARGGQFLTSTIDLQVTHATQRSIALIEAKGGKVTCFDHDKHTIRALLNPHKFLGEPKPSSVFDKGVPARYFDAARRGYLADQVDKLMERVAQYKEKQKN
ncbi:ribosomal protein L18e/L15P [Chytriomyces sp. MP71]|nr:ribosomal protein L18e/L15P [Chytriomyces sp. MP71]